MKGIVGLSNIGNTCYGNATIQALRHQVDFTIFLLQNQHQHLVKKKGGSERSRFLESYAELIRNLWTNEKGYESTKDLWGTMVPTAIKAGFEHFRIPAPHDAHEFLCFMLDEFHEAMSEEVTMTVRTNTDSSDIRGALLAWKRNFEKNYSPLVEIVFGLSRKSIVCKDCGHESISWDTMNMIKTSVPKQADPIDLLDALQQDAKEELIDGYKCDKCTKTVQVSVKHSLWRLGNWVIVVLKRFDNQGHRINTQVNVPFEMKFEPLFHSGSQEPSHQDTYELFATIHHHGSARGGHYTSYAKHPVTEKWAYYDDERATVLDTSPRLDESTYITMYRRVSSN